jgi:hypothetical protein
MYGSARSSSSPPPASPARVTDALAGLGVDDDPRAAIAGLIRATPKRERTSSAGSDDSNTAVTSPAASSAAAAAADVIARARAAALSDDAVWRTAEAAVDAVAAATRPATLEDGERTKRRARLSAGDAAHVVARAASARAEHAAEVAAAAAAHAAAAAAFARASPGASADEEASAAARLADDAADAATRAAADATASAARAEQTSARVASLRLAELQGASVWDPHPHPHPHPHEASEGLPPTPPVKARGGVSNAADGDGTETPRGALPPSPTSARRASALFSGVFRDFHSEPACDSPARVRAPGSLGKPRRVPISEHDALLFDAAEAKLRLREGRRRAAAAFAAPAPGGADALGALDANDAARADSKRGASNAVARALESAGAAPARRAERLPQGHGVLASRRAVDAMDRAAARTRARAVRLAGPPGSDRDATARASGEAAIAEDPGSPLATDANRVSVANARGGKPTEADGRRGAPRRYDPGSFDVSLVNAHTRFHGEMNQTDKRLFQKDLRSARLAATRAAAAAAAGGGDGGGVGAGDPSRCVGPRPTKKSRAAAAAAAERTRRAGEARAERIREAEAVVGSFAPFKASPAPSPAKPARPLPVRGAGTSVSPPPARRALPSGGASAEKRETRNASRAGGSPSASSPPTEKEKGSKGSPSDSLVAARALLADLQSGVPVSLDEPFPHPAGAAAGAKSTWHELREAGRRSVARVRAYRSAEKASPPGATPAHERYQHYKMMGFGGMGAKTSWAR